MYEVVTVTPNVGGLKFIVTSPVALSKDAVIQLGVVGVTTLIAIGLPVVLKIDELDTPVSQKVGFCPTPEKYDALVLGLTVMVPETTALPVQPPAPAEINKYT